MNSLRKILILLMIGTIAFSWVACKTLFPPPKPKVTASVTPEKVELKFPDIMRVPIVFTGTGWSPKEMVVVDLVLPPGVEMKGAKPGEDVGIAFGQANEAGSFKAEVPVTAKLNTLFRVGWTPIMAPDPKTLNPIPPGVYKIKVSGADSGAMTTITLEFVAPVKK